MQKDEDFRVVVIVGALIVVGLYTLMVLQMTSVVDFGRFF